MQSGKVKHYNSDKGYGFIDVDNQTEDAFFHISKWQLSQPPSVGQQVYLTSEYNDKNQLRATKVSSSPVAALQKPSKRPSSNPQPNAYHAHRSYRNTKRSGSKSSWLSHALTALVIVVAIVFAGSKLFDGGQGGDLGKAFNDLTSDLNNQQQNNTTSASTSSWSTQPTITGDTQIDQTIALIKKGGPFPYPDKDGTPFYNREGRLPNKPRGYYREYTVPTPGVSHRGARRIVTGGNPPTLYYLTVDHYGSFKKLEVNE